MSKTNASNSEFHLIENDTQYKVVPRRRSERRNKASLNSKPEFNLENDSINVQKVNKKQLDSVREDERRQSGRRRTSRPTLLSVDEIVILRKN